MKTPYRADAPAPRSEGMTVYLRKGRSMPFELHAPFAWVDSFTRKPETYLAGLLTQENALAYAARHGWKVVTE